MISSKQNSLIKEIRSLSDKKFRDSLNLYVAHGVKLVNEAVELNMPIKVIVGTEKGLSLINCKDFKTECVTEEVFSSISDDKSPQGVLCVIEKPSNEICQPNGSAILLDGVSDPANVGAIIRTAAASGYKNVYLTLDCADAFSSKSTRCSMSGVFRVNIARASVEEILSKINLPLIVADMSGENLFEFKPKGDYLLVIGNEGHGVSAYLKEKANFTVSIPMANGVESLNAGVSAGLLMYALKGKC